MKSFDLSLYLITAESGERAMEETIRLALEGGVTMVQLREKQKSTRDLIDWARRIRTLTRRFGVPLIINDRVDVALAVEADGVHLGDEDMPAGIARKLLGDRKIIGRSAHTPEEARNAAAEGADYLGVGTVFSTSSKSNIKGLLGADGLKRVCASVAIPCVAIGGISLSNAVMLQGTGAKGIAVISALMNTDDPKTSAEQFRKIVSQF